MSPFLIFAISLTIAYAIYYAVMITRDLYGKKEEAKSNEEVFDISNITEEEAAVAVMKAMVALVLPTSNTTQVSKTTHHTMRTMAWEQSVTERMVVLLVRILLAEKMMLMKTMKMTSTNRSRRTQPSRCRKRWMDKWSPPLPYG